MLVIILQCSVFDIDVGVTLTPTCLVSQTCSGMTQGTSKSVTRSQNSPGASLKPKHNNHLTAFFSKVID